MTAPSTKLLRGQSRPSSSCWERLSSAWRCLRCSAWRSSRAPIPDSSSSTSRLPPARDWSVTNAYVARVENDIRDVIGNDDLQMIVSNIGLTPDLSSIYTSNSGQHTAFIQVSLKHEHTRQHLCLHGPGAAKARRRPARNLDLLPNRAAWWTRWSTRECRRRSIFKLAATIRHAAYEVAAELAAEAAQLARCQRRADSAGPRLSRHPTRCQARDGRPLWDSPPVMSSTTSSPL